MSTLLRASRQWASRPADERFTSLPAMLADQTARRERSKAKVMSSRRLLAEPVEGDTAEACLTIRDQETDEQTVPTHWAFGQLAQLSKAPASYLRTLPTPLVADCINWGLKYSREIQDVGVLVRSDRETLDGDAFDEYAALAAATGPNYGRVWNSEIIEQIIHRFGDGVTGEWRVPGEFGEEITVNKANTTLYAGDRDMFVFLADEKNKIEIPGEGNFRQRLLSRGFFVWNSEVGASSWGIAMFLFDYACRNRTVWGAMDYQELRLRHTASAPDRFIEEIAPALSAMKDSSTHSITKAIEDARASRLDNVDEFLAKRFSKRLSVAMQSAHMTDEGRPVETLYDAANAITAYARNVNWQDDRVALEREAGKVLAMAS